MGHSFESHSALSKGLIFIQPHDRSLRVYCVSRYGVDWASTGYDMVANPALIVVSRTEFFFVRAILYALYCI